MLYGFSSSGWAPIGRPTKRTERGKTLRTTHWNIWSGERRLRGHRLAAAWQYLFSGELADLIALHEVSTAVERSLRTQRIVKENYALTSLDDFWSVAGRRDMRELPDEDVCGSLVLVHKSILSACAVTVVTHAFESTQQARGCIQLNFVSRTGSVRVVAAQYESNTRTSGSSAQQRGSQYSQTMSLLDDSPAVLLLDTNAVTYDELDPFSALEDVWPALHPVRDLLRSDATFGELVPYFDSKRVATRKARRIDVALVTGVKAKSARTFGCDPLRDHKGHLRRYHLGRDGHCFASDHLGLSVTFSLV